MTLCELRRLPLLQTGAIAASWGGSPETFKYISECLNRFYNGDYGEVSQEDTDANNSDLLSGEGHILARYAAKYNLDADVYIEAYISESMPGIDSNYIMIMYCNER